MPEAEAAEGEEGKLSWGRTEDKERRDQKGGNQKSWRQTKPVFTRIPGV